MEWWIVVWLAMAIGAGAVAASKGRSFAGYFILAALVPLVGLLVAIGMSPITAPHRPQSEGDLIHCHKCYKPRRVDALTCPHCGAGRPDPTAGHKKCVACSEWILRDARKCKHCGELQNPPRVSIVHESSEAIVAVSPTLKTIRPSDGVDWNGVRHSDRNTGRPV